MSHKSITETIVIVRAKYQSEKQHLIRGFDVHFHASSTDVKSPEC